MYNCIMNLQKISGILIFLSFIVTIYSYFFSSSIFVLSGILAWFALIILFQSSSNKKLLIVLIVLSIICFSFSYLRGFDIDLKRAILVNQYLLTLLIGVGFLRLIATPKEEKVKALPRGKNSFIKTYFGIHLFGSVINLSALILVADKLSKTSRLTKEQIIVLTRAFSSDAYWSPFFVAFAAASTYAPNLSTITIIFFGLILATIAFIFTYLDISSNKCNIDEFEGYPIHFETLYLPFVLALMVILANHYYPQLKVILLISFFSIVLTSVILPFKSGIKNAVKKLNTHVFEELPKMKNELALFLVAGMFGVSVSSILIGFNISLPFEHFDGISASILLLILILLSFVGIHPIISIAVIGNWVGDLNQTLLAATFLMSWSTAVSTSPFSGVNLTMQSRYNLNAIEIFKINIFYALKMYIVCVIILLLLSNYLGI